MISSLNLNNLCVELRWLNARYCFKLGVQIVQRAATGSYEDRRSLSYRRESIFKRWAIDTGRWAHPIGGG